MKIDLSARDREIRLFEQTKHSSVRSQTIQLNSSRPAISIAYAYRVMESQAKPLWMRRAEAEKEMHGDIDALSSNPSASQLRIRQSMEEEVLNAGLEAVVERGATPAQAPRGTMNTDNSLLSFSQLERRRKERKL